ncbi:MAG: hypothetical protein NC242_03890 [Roseburia sp.]|nr:hypothetical protein [Roseburia sp.]
MADCQNLAVALGTRIETFRGMGTSVVSELEKYCELVYGLGELVSAEEETGTAYQALAGQLEIVREELKREIPDKKEVIFLPYKASMWDSLESVWRAADEDVNCDAFVIPIPYFDKDSNGSFGKMHYERDLYPADVPITDWQMYSIEDRQPDMIFIHNPYDEYNTVTSVHPDYYSERLKLCTDSLVYIPYFMLEEVDPKDQAAVEKISHFVQTKGLIYADTIIVQSEAMKQIYVNEYVKFAKSLGLTGKHLDRNYQEKRILGLGSPKVDKVLNTQKEKLDVPEEWLRLIQRPDGSWKKVIFYNTGITAMLNGGEKWLDKLEDTFRYMREEWSDAVFLWRPHPLMHNSIQSMRSHLWKRYRKMETAYQAEAWGIYDDSTDLDRAIALSDAYYGDGSSVVQLFEAVGKPVMIQCVAALHDWSSI